jgi:hypothetical protein
VFERKTARLADMILAPVGMLVKSNFKYVKSSSELALTYMLLVLP